MSKDRFNRFAWRDDVFADSDVAAKVKCLAYGMAKFINHETGEAHVGTRALAEACGNSQKWVRDTIPMLSKTGWLRVLHKGRPGSGPECAGRYKMNRKREYPVYSHSDVTKPVTREYFLPFREYPGYSEPLNHKSAPPARSSERVDRVDVIEIDDEASLMPIEGTDEIPF